MATIKEIANKMRAYKLVNSFISKHPKYATNRVLGAIDKWSFRHSPTFKKWVEDSKKP